MFMSVLPQLSWGTRLKTDGASICKAVHCIYFWQLCQKIPDLIHSSLVFLFCVGIIPLLLGIAAVFQLQIFMNRYVFIGAHLQASAASAVLIKSRFALRYVPGLSEEPVRNSRLSAHRRPRGGCIHSARFPPVR